MPETNLVCWDCETVFTGKLQPCIVCGSIRIDLYSAGERLTHYYDRQGTPITFYEYALLYKPDYKMVEQTVINDIARVSTIWLGIDHAWSSTARRQIFETMVFAVLHDDDAPHPFWGRPLLTSLEDRFEVRRYATEDEARAGHDQVVAEVRHWVQQQLAGLHAALGEIETGLQQARDGDVVKRERPEET